MNNEILTKIQDAVSIVEQGIAKRIDVSDEIIVYRVQSTIRIDIKNK